MILNFIKKYGLYLVPVLIAASGAFHIFTYLFVVYTVLLFVRYPKYILDIQLIVLVLFLASYNYETETGGLVGRSFQVLFPVCFYIMGKLLILIMNRENDVILLLITFIIAFSSMPLLGYVLNVFQ